MPTKLQRMIEEDSEALLPDKEQLSDLTYLVGRRDELLERQKELSLLSSNVTGALVDIDSRLIPDAMSNAGMSKFTTKDGRTVSYKTEFRGNIRNPKAVQWLVKNGFEDLLKDDITVKFTRGQRTDAQALMKHLDQVGDAYDEKIHIPWNTLSGFIRERREKGDAFPEELFDVTEFYVTKVKS